ncbi:MAG: hypothetical protein L6R37_001942 [Teloschistes peruensis]|nr:MAG: hypothetical protein L6R37_001942 [Teloschistes peruensis]
MAYNDDALKARLSSLNESSDSIAAVAQWIIFHRRHANRTCTTWLERLREAPANKRLTLIYLANEVVQQSIFRKKEDFVVAFSPIIAEATATVYRGATTEVQDKIKRTTDVWRTRNVFDKTVQDTVEARIAEIDRSRSGKKGGLLGKSLFSGGSDASAPPELQPLIPLQIAVSKANAAAEPATTTAIQDFEKLTDPSKPTPSPPVYAARLSALFKSLSSAESAVAERIKTRQDLVDGLEKLLATNRTALDKEKTQQTTLQERGETIERKKTEVEDAIMRGGAAATATGTFSPVTTETSNGNNTAGEPERPKFEELTPPPTESLTPTHSPKFHHSSEQIPPINNHNFATSRPDDLAAHHHHHHHQYPGTSSDPRTSSAPIAYHSAHPQPSHDPCYAVAPSAKKRKLDAEFEGFGAGEDAMAGLDDDVAELLRAESGGV